MEDKLKFIFTAPIVLAVIGQTGCGKHTQYEAFAHEHKKIMGKELFYLETGELFRNEIPKMSEFNRGILELVQSQGLLQDPLIAAMLWGHRFLFEYPKDQLIFLDGSPRSIEEVKYLLRIFCRHGGKDLHVAILHITEEEAMKRMEHRDNERIKAGNSPRPETMTLEARENKLKYFHEKVVPAVQQLEEGAFLEEQAGRNVYVHKIKGMATPQEVTDQIVHSINSALVH